jgi:hypothetical protein
LPPFLNDLLRDAHISTGRLWFSVVLHLCANFELGMVSVSDGFADRETEAGTTCVAAARIVSAI